MIKQFYKDFKVRDYIGEEEKSDISSNTIDCSLGTNPFLNEKLINQYIRNGHSKINAYPINGYDMLKKVLIHFWRDRNGCKVNEKNLAFGSGTIGILRNISEFLIDKNTYVLGYSPQFPRFISEIELKMGIYEYYSLSENNNFKFETEEFLKMINDKYNMIIIDNPNNPTGQIISIENIESIVKEAKKYDINVIIDETYGEYMDNKNSSIHLVNQYDNIAVLRSASKFFGLPNHRIGYLFADEKFIKIYNMISLPFAFSDLSANIFAELICHYDEFEHTKQQVLECKKKILNELNEKSYLYTNVETPIFTIKSDKYDNLTKELVKEGIITERCNEYINLNGSYTRIRVTDKTEELIKALKKIF